MDPENGLNLDNFLQEYAINVIFLHPNHREFTVTSSKSEHIEIAAETAIELKIPFKTIELSNNVEVMFYIEIYKNNNPMFRYPRHVSFRFEIKDASQGTIGW
jgi:hypothetical protein